jgi:hypothetical protein
MEGTTRIGVQAMRSITAFAFNNTAIGYQTLYANTSGVYNVAVGAQALLAATGNYNTSIGTFNMLSLVGGQLNTSVGYNSLVGIAEGSYNTAMGALGLPQSTGDRNTECGFGSFASLEEGDNNIALGAEAGNYEDTMGGNLSICDNSIFIGVKSKANANSETNQIVIGHEAVGLGSNTAVLGNSSIEKTGLHGYLILDEIEPPSGVTPASGTGFLYIDMSDSKLKFKDDGGSVYDLTT